MFAEPNSVDPKLKKIQQFAQKHKTAIACVAGTLSGSAVTAFVIYTKTKSDYDNLLTLPLGKEAFNALVNDETNFVWFKTGKHDHVFHVTLEQ
jgi:hypothetical protein